MGANYVKIEKQMSNNKSLVRRRNGSSGSNFMKINHFDVI